MGEAEEEDEGETFWTRTGRLFQEAFALTVGRPTTRDRVVGTSSVPLASLATLWTILVVKTVSVRRIFRAVIASTAASSDVRRSVALEIGKLCRLTLFGGSLVTANSVPTERIMNKERTPFVTIHLLSVYVLGTMSGKRHFETGCAHYLLPMTTD